MMTQVKTALCFTAIFLFNTAAHAEPKVSLDDNMVYPLMFVIGATGNEGTASQQREDSDLRIHRDEFAFYPEYRSVSELHQVKAASAWLLGRKLFSRPKVDIPLRLDSFQQTEVYDPCRDAKRYSLVRNDPLTLRCFSADGEGLYLQSDTEDEDSRPDWFLDLEPANDETPAD